MKTTDGKCSDCSCYLRTSEGYCQLTACIKSSNSITYTNNTDFVQVGSLTKITDEGIKSYIKLYLKDHSLSDLMQILADIV